MEFNRTKNAKKAITSGMFVKIIAVIMPFLMRTIIIYTLGNLYLGLGSLFSSILNALSIAELGIGSALVFSMYRPVANNDIDAICALLNTYKKVYYIIGIVILIMGLLLFPWLPQLIKGNYPEDINIYVIYIIQLSSSVVGYFFLAYKGSLLVVYQRADISNLAAIITDMFMYMLQIIALIIFKNYYYYALLVVFRNIIYNYLISRITKRMFPGLNAHGNLDNETQRAIFKKMWALTGHKISEVVINSTDNILISMYIGLEMVAIYNNYFYVITAISGIILMMCSGMIPIVGNYLITEDAENVNRLFGVLNYINALVVSVCCTCLLNMYQPFMTIWTGENNLFPEMIVMLFVIYFYTIRIRTVISLFGNAAGIWEKELKKAYIMTIINFVLDIMFIERIGVKAALISTIISLIFAFIYETVILHKYILKKNMVPFLAKNVIYMICTLASCTICYKIIAAINIRNNYMLLIVGGLLATFVSCICFYIGTFWSRECKESWIFIRKRI